jgi:hypothetical protein
MLSGGGVWSAHAYRSTWQSNCPGPYARSEQRFQMRKWPPWRASRKRRTSIAGLRYHASTPCDG